MVNPTEGKIGAELGTGVRKAYFNGFHPGPDGMLSPGKAFGRDPSAGVLSGEDLAAPFKSSKLRPVTAGVVPVCGAGGGANVSCVPDRGRSRVLTDAEVKDFQDRVKARVEADRNRSPEFDFISRLSAEEQVVVARLMVDGLGDDVRGLSVKAPGGVDAKFPGILGGVNRLGALPLPGFPDTKKLLVDSFKRSGAGLAGELGDPFTTVELLTAVIGDSSKLGIAAAATGWVPVVGSILGLADSAQSGDLAGITLGAIQLVTDGLNVLLGSGLLSGAVAASVSMLALGLGVIGTVAAVGLGIMQLVMWANDKMNGPDPAEFVKIPEKKFTKEWTEATMQAGFPRWSHGVMLASMKQIIETVKPSYDQTVAVIGWNTIVLQESAAQLGAVNGTSAGDVAKQVEGIRAEGRKNLARAREGAKIAARAPLKSIAESLNHGQWNAQYRDIIWKEQLLPEWKKWAPGNFFPGSWVDVAIGKTTDSFTVEDIRNGKTGTYENADTKTRLWARINVPYTWAGADPIKPMIEVPANPTTGAPAKKVSPYTAPIKPVVPDTYHQILEESIEGKNKFVDYKPSFAVPEIPGPLTTTRDLAWEITTPVAKHTEKDEVPETHKNLIRLINGTGKAGKSYQLKDQDQNILCEGTVSRYGTW